MPQDIRSSPDGTRFYAADMKQNGVHVIDPIAFHEIAFITPDAVRTGSIRAAMERSSTSRTGDGTRSREVTTVRVR